MSADDESKPTLAAPDSTPVVADLSAIIPDTSVDNGAAAEKPQASAEPTTSSTPLPATDSTNSAEKGESQPSVPEPLKELAALLPGLVTSAGHSEIWGVELSTSSTLAHIPTQIILQKYLNANDGNVAKAKEQLSATLQWRAKMKPLDLLTKKFSKVKFDGLGYVTTYTASEQASGPRAREIFTWNIYGGVKSLDETFGNLEEFLGWRVALMELALQSLSISSATEPITSDDRSDPYKITQVHDYKSISFLRQSPIVKTASTETIKVFAQNYPELLKEKFFLNVPAVMGFIYSIIKLFVAEKTRRKFHPMSNGAALAKEFDMSTLPTTDAQTDKVYGLGKMLPKEYGGEGKELVQTGMSVALE